MNYQKLFKRDYLIYFTGKIIPGLVGLLSISVFIRLFGEAIYGEFSVLYSTFLLFLSLTTGWLCQGIIRFHSTYEGSASFSNSVYKLLVLAVSVSLIPAIILLIYTGYNFLLILILILSFFLGSFNSVFLTEAQAGLTSKMVVGSNTVRAVFFMIIPIILFYFNISSNAILTLVLGIMVSFFVGNLVIKWKQKEEFFYIFYRKFLVSDDATRSIFQKIWRYGWPLSFWFVFATLLNISDRYIIAYYLDMQDVGKYSAVYEIVSKSLILFITPILTSVFPILVKLYSEDLIKDSKEILTKAIIYQFIAFIVIFIFLLLTREYLVLKILDIQGDQNAVSIVLPIFIGSFLWQLSMLVHKPLELKEQTKRLLYAIVWALLANIVGNFVLIPIYGYKAAAYTTILGSLIYLSLVGHHFFKMMKKNA